MRRERKNYSLTERQGQILKYIAEHGPCDMYAISKAAVLHQHYRNVHGIVRDHLEHKGMVQILAPPEGDAKHRTKALQWFATPRGMVSAIEEGADPRKIRARVNELTGNGNLLLKDPEDSSIDDYGTQIMDLCQLAEELTPEDWSNLTDPHFLLWAFVRELRRNNETENLSR